MFKLSKRFRSLRSGLSTVAFAAGVAALSLVSAPANADQFRWGDARDLSGLEPHYEDLFVLGMLANIYEPLAFINAKGELEPRLATAWEQVEPLRWRFTLRQGVKFHDGDTFDADDVIFSIERARTPNAVMPLIKPVIDKVERVDDYTVDIITTVVDPILPATMWAFYVMSKEWAEANNATVPGSRAAQEETFATRNTNGTGPFSLVEWNPGVSVEFAPNAQWWGGPRTDKLTSAKFFTIAEQSTKLSALLSGEVDLVTNVAPNLLDRVEQAGGVHLITGRQLQTVFLNMDLVKDELQTSNVKGVNPFKDVRVREAMYLAIDVDAINSRIFRGLAYPSNLMTSPESTGWDAEQDSRAAVDLDKARALMADAGYPEGFSVTFDCTNGVYLNDEQLCAAISIMLSQIGIKAEVLYTARGPYFTKVQAPTWGSDLHLMGYTFPTFDAITMMDRVFRSRDTTTGFGALNGAGWSNAEVDKLIEGISLESNPVARQALFTKVWEIYNEERPYIALYQSPVLWAARDNVTAAPDPVNRVILSTITLN